MGLQQVQEDFQLLQLSGYLAGQNYHSQSASLLYCTILALGRICLRAVFPPNLTGKSPWCLPLG